MGYRKLSARPRHHEQAEGAIEDFKNVWPARSQRMARPVRKGVCAERSASDQSASTYPASKVSPPAMMEIRVPRSS